MKAIETVYKGYRFRSRAEARWAIFFDEMGMKWYYEPEGFKMSDGTTYLPDFYLPDCHTYFEVKGIMAWKDWHKIVQFSKEANVPVAVGYPDMTFDAPHNMWDSEYLLLPDRKDDSYIARCYNCNGLFFVGSDGSYQCPCCGYYCGNATFYVVGIGDLSYLETGDSGFKNAIEKAKKARFEHGESA